MAAVEAEAPAPSIPQSALDKLVALYRWEGFRQAVRVALAMVVAYYISLSMGWDRPQWAGLAVALCSLATVGDSINKGLLRILGTFLAGGIALMLAALFPQDRWAYLLVATLYIAFCSYMMASTSRWYFWFIGGYVMALLAMAGGPEGSTLFETTVLRLQQTTMGLVVYMIIANVLWPVRAAPVFDRALSQVLMAQRGLFKRYRAQLAGAVADDEVGKLRAEAAHVVSELPSIQNSAELDSFDVWDKRHQWRRCVADLADLNDALESTHYAISDLTGVELATLTPRLDNAAEEIETRFAQIQRMIDGDPPRQKPRKIGDMVDSAALEPLTHFNRAAVLIFLDLLERLDRISRRLFDTVADIRGFGPKTTPTTEALSGGPSAFDPDRLSAALRTFVALWAILLACIYVPGLPMPPGVVPMTAAIAIQLSIFPYMALSATVIPGLGATALAWLFHVFVMPHLHSYIGLGAGIFLVIFLVMILMAKPQYALGRPIVTSFFVMVILVQNEQTYNPVFAMNYGIAFILALTAVWIAGLFPISFSPRPAFLGRLERFFTSCRRLTESVRGVGEGTRSSFALAYHILIARYHPGKIRPWIARQPAVAEGRIDRDRLYALADSLEMLSARLRHLVDLRDLHQADELRNELRGDVRSWRLAIQEILGQLAQDPKLVDAQALRERLDSKLARLTKRIESTINGLPVNAVTTNELMNMFRLLGGYRGVSEAIVVVAERAGDIDWDAIREERF
jgi:uncharacterized membrane protein YccC